MVAIVRRRLVVVFAVTVAARAAIRAFVHCAEDRVNKFSDFFTRRRFVKIDGPMAERDFSQMPVQFETEADAVTRCVRRKGFSLKAGSYVDVEVGATWSSIGGRQERVGGQWRQCVVLKVVHSTVHVRLCPHPHLDSEPDTLG